LLLKKSLAFNELPFHQWAASPWNLIEPERETISKKTCTPPLFEGVCDLEAPFHLDRSVILDCVKISLVHIGSRPGARGDFEDAVAAYIERCSQFARCSAQAFRNEQAFLQSLDRQQGRTPAVPVLFDGRGRQLSSESFAKWLGSRRDQGAQHIVFAIGPADGWSAEASQYAQLWLSLGPFTLPHSLARLVVAEQLYRAFTILSGHPYHCGH
jgi:23S rRNA (pseudouridine1915-N3)-methyltransferase